MLDPATIAIGWDGLKSAFVPDGMAARTVIHIHLGLAVYLAIALARGRGLRSWTGLLAVAALALGHEWIDARSFTTLHETTMPRWLWVDTISDLASTLAWPLLLALFAPAAARHSPAETGSEDAEAEGSDADE